MRLDINLATHPHEDARTFYFRASAMVGAIAATGYTHNLYYSLEEPGRRARNAGIHEALVGAIERRLRHDAEELVPGEPSQEGEE